MAKKSTTTPPQHDPATLAFSAVEDALKDSVFAGLDQPSAPAEPAERPAPKPAAREAARTERQRTADKFASQTGSVANDDRFQSTKILYGLQPKTNGAPSWIAFAVAAGWIAAVALVAVVRNGSQFSSAGSTPEASCQTFMPSRLLPALNFSASAGRSS